MEKCSNGKKVILTAVFNLLVIFAVFFGDFMRADAADYSGWAAVFDPAYYMAHNQDAATYAAGNVDRLWAYFNKVGIPKGDQASEEFNVYIYAKNYPELVTAYGQNMVQYYIHYATKGKAAGLNARTLNNGESSATPASASNLVNGISNVPEYMTMDVYKVFSDNIKVQNEFFDIQTNFNSAINLCRNLTGKSISSADEKNISNYRITGGRGDTKISVSYLDNKQETAQVMAFINATAPSLKGASDFETIKKVHNFICDNADYDYDTYYGNGYGFGAYENLIGKKSVCQGYAVAFQRYMDYFGIPCYVASGIVNGGPHAWNIVYLEGAWYHIDTTWDGQTDKTRNDFFLLGAERCGYSQFGGGASPVVTMAAKSHAK